MDKRRRIFLLLTLSLCISSEGLVARATTLRGAKSARSPQAVMAKLPPKHNSALSPNPLILFPTDGSANSLSSPSAIRTARRELMNTGATQS